MDHARLDGRYALERLLERGASAEVWLARDERLGRLVAVKLANTPAADGYREALAVGSLAHPHIVAVHDAGLHDGRPFLVMDHLEGGSLRARLAQGPLPADEVARIGVDIAGALAFAHQRGLVHNDLKPENILFDASGAARLADFGAATIPTQTLTPAEARHFAGTVAYLAAEVLSGEPASPSSDLYSLALTLVEALTGHLPPRATVVRPEDLPAPHAMATALATALDPWPARRHSDAAAFARALGSLPAGAPAATAPPPPRSAVAAATPVRIGRHDRPPPPPPLSPPANRRAPAIAALSAAVLVPLLAAAAALGAFDRGSGPEDDRTGSVTTSATSTPEPDPTAVPTATSTPEPEPTADSGPPTRGRDKPKPDKPGRGNDDDDDDDDDDDRTSIITITLN